MSKHYIVIERPEKLHVQIDGVEIISAKSYLTDKKFLKHDSCKIFNMCSSFRYQSLGHYVSLLAEARKHKVIPDSLTIQDLKNPVVTKILSLEFDLEMQQALKNLPQNEFTLSVYFGKNITKQYNGLCKRIFHHFKVPLLRAEFERDEKWELKSLRPISLSDIPENHLNFLKESMSEFFESRFPPRPNLRNFTYDLAILVNPNDHSPPSDKKAIEAFVRAGKKFGILAEIVTKEDSARIEEFDALFIRETTCVNHHTYRLARKAFACGLYVIDDPDSILRCSNKVYLEEMLEKNRVSRPTTTIVHQGNRVHVSQKMTYPCVLKQPDSAFSKGVFKVGSQAEFLKITLELLDQSDLIIAQDFLPSGFDWRIGILDNRPIYACKYHMAKDHWQIIDHTKTHDDDKYGMIETLPIEMVPTNVLKTALKAAQSIGRGLYGVDLKQVGEEIYVIEVNDNPSMDHGVEDKVLGDKLYETIMEHFYLKLNHQRLISNSEQALIRPFPPINLQKPKTLHLV